jgi:hypothetical protein
MSALARELREEAPPRRLVEVTHRMARRERERLVDDERQPHGPLSEGHPVGVLSARAVSSR